MEAYFERLSKLNISIRNNTGEVAANTRASRDILSVMSDHTSRILDRLDKLSGNLGGTAGSTTPSGQYSTVNHQLTHAANTINANLGNLSTEVQKNTNALQNQTTTQKTSSEKNLLAQNLIVGGLTLMANNFSRMYSAMRDIGQTPVTAFQESLGTAMSFWERMTQAFTKDGTFTSRRQEEGLRVQMADILMARSQERIEDMRTMVGLVRDPATTVQLQRTLERTAGITETGDFARRVRNLSGTDAPGAILRKMAENGDLFANAANRSAEAMTNLIQNTEKLGVSISSISGFADRMTGDFETFLDAQAQLQVVMPGVDLTSAVMAAQYGSEDDVLIELQKAMAGRDIGQLPRSIRQMISNSFGISQDQLVNLGRPMAAADKTIPKGTDEPEDKIAGAAADMVGAVAEFARSIHLFELIVGSMFFNRGVLGGGATRMFRGLGRGLAAGSSRLAIGLAATSTAYGMFNEWNDPKNDTLTKQLRNTAVEGGTRLANISAKAIIGGLLGGVAGGIGGFLVGGPGGALAGAAWLGRTGASIGAGIGAVEPTTNAIKKYHSGGVVHSGTIQKDEVPAVLQTGEAILSRMQLDGLTKLVDGISELGKIGETISRTISPDAIKTFGKTLGDITGIFSGSSGVLSVAGGIASGGIGQTISGILGGNLGNIGSTITGAIGNIGKSISGIFGGEGGIGGAISGLLGNSGIGKTISGIGSTISGIFGGEGGIGGAISGLLGGGSGGIGGAISGLLGGGGIGSAISGLIGGSGVGNVLGGVASSLGLGNVLGGLAGGPVGIVASLAAPLLEKVPVVGSLVGGASKAISSVTGAIGGAIGGLFGNSKDKERLDKNQQMFQRALGGDMEALNFLKQRTGRFGEAKVGGSMIGGWATDKAKRDAMSKYAQAVKQLGGAEAVAAMSDQSAGVEGQQQTYQDGGMSASKGASGSQQTTLYSSGGGDSGVVAKLDELIDLIRGGALNVSMDGKKVGDQLVSSHRYSRG